MFTSDSETPSNQPSPATDDKKDQSVGEAVKICPQCHTANAASSKYCNKCGNALPEQAPANTAPVKICPGCRTPNLPASQYCYKCGLKLPEQASIPATFLISAGFWRRFASFVIDNIIVIIGGLIFSVIIMAILFAVFPEWAAQYDLNEYTWDVILTASNNQPTWLDWMATLFVFIFGIVYWTITIGWKGQSLGKLMLGLKVVKVDGGRVGFLRAFGRVWGYILDIFTLGIGFLVIALDEQKRGLHDIIFKTKVVRV